MNTLLPASSGVFEKAFEQALGERWEQLHEAVPLVVSAKEVPLPSFIPFLAWEFGLGMLTPYVPNLYELIYEGVRWFRLRGTYAGVEKGLSFINVTAALEPAWHGRAWWNSNQLRLSELPGSDTPALERIEGVTKLSLPFRSDFRRGVFGYDVQPVELDASPLDGAHVERESGVAYGTTTAIWSFGRTTELEHTLTEAEGTALGNWIVPPTSASLRWADMHFRWSTALLSWSANPAAQRRILMAQWFAGKDAYLRLRRGDGSVIGYRRCRIICGCSPSASGFYSHGGALYSPDESGQRVYIEARTDFGDAPREFAEMADIILSGTRAVGVPKGKLWLEAGELSGGVAIASKPIAVPLRETVRDQFKLMLRF
ncbi:phage tail protein [Gellertiella hungarica]|uniref:Phage tail protein n=1 Tax=Gellertiella hungarica TaxID=1572859 RepID=A0A7W6NLT8_9HYPH|nr:phage tail protein [Gellertiella hungarica]MBB4066278.1 hypothetical protein [Gellertiella hungarica]